MEREEDKNILNGTMANNMEDLKTISILFTAALIATGLSSCEKVDYPDRYHPASGVPTIHSIRYADSDTYIEQAFMEEVAYRQSHNL